MKASVKRHALVGIAVLAAALSANLASATNATNADNDVRRAVVSYSDLDLSQSKDVQRFYRRVRHAARQVCDNSPGLDLRLLSEYNACMKKAMSEAANQVRSAQQLAVARRADSHL